MENTNQTERFITTDVGATIDRATYELLETHCNKNFIKRGKLLGDIVIEWDDTNLKHSKKKSKK